MKDNQLHKIHFKCGDIELDFEGKFQEIVKEFKTFVEEVIPKIRPMMPPEATERKPPAISKPNIESGEVSDLHLSSLVSRMDSSSMPDIVLVTCYYLYKYKSMPRFTRKTILEEARESGRYTKNVVNNLTAILRRLVKRGHLAMFSNKDYTITVPKGIESATSLIGESPS
jgi:hypothetical protein